MTSSENLRNETDLRQRITEEILRDPLLIPEHGIYFKVADETDAAELAELYRSAFERGDFLTRRYGDQLQEQILNPDWLVRELSDPGHVRSTFIDNEQRLLGATALFHDDDSEAGPLMTSDGTEIDPRGRGLRIMDHFFKRVVPVLKASGAGVAADFMLTPESKSLRQSLQTDLGMIAIGIRPHALQNRQLGISRSLITGMIYNSLTPKPLNIVPEFERLYRIVQAQLPLLPEPEIVPHGQSVPPPEYVNQPEISRAVGADDPRAQLQSVMDGWRPVEYNPDKNTFMVARFPGQRPELDFILDKEKVPANRQLVRYLYDVLYKEAQPASGRTK